MAAIVLNGILAGSSALLIWVTGLTTAIICFSRAKKSGSNLLIWVGIFFLCMGSFYLGTVCSFINLIFTDANLPTALVGQLCYTWAPIGVAVSMFIGFTMIRPKSSLKTIFTAIILITALPYWYGLYFLSATQISSDIAIANANGWVIDIELVGWVKLMTVFYLVSFALILDAGFIWLARNSTGIIKRKSILTISGLTLFFICGAMDSLFGFSYLIIVVRVFMVGAYILLFSGFT
jgi:hypothetical protein